MIYLFVIFLLYYIKIITAKLQVKIAKLKGERFYYGVIGSNGTISKDYLVHKHVLEYRDEVGKIEETYYHGESSCCGNDTVDFIGIVLILPHIAFLYLISDLISARLELKKCKHIDKGTNFRGKTLVFHFNPFGKLKKLLNSIMKD